MARPEIYVSTDVETDGPVPGLHSMLSLGCAAFQRGRGLISTFSANLHTAAGAQSHPDTMAWWATQPEAWAACRRDLQDPAVAMQACVAWLDTLPGKLVFVGMPASFDFMFVHSYLHRYAGRSPFSHSALDIKSVAMTLLRCEFRAASKARFPSHWFGPGRHTHIALDDAIEQGELLLNMLDARDGVASRD